MAEPFGPSRSKVKALAPSGEDRGGGSFNDYLHELSWPDEHRPAPSNTPQPQHSAAPFPCLRSAQPRPSAPPPATPLTPSISRPPFSCFALPSLAPTPPQRPQVLPPPRPHVVSPEGRKVWGAAAEAPQSFCGVGLCDSFFNVRAYVYFLVMLNKEKGEYCWCNRATYFISSGLPTAWCNYLPPAYEGDRCTPRWSDLPGGLVGAPPVPGCLRPGQALGAAGDGGDPWPPPCSHQHHRTPNGVLALRQQTHCKIWGQAEMRADFLDPQSHVRVWGRRVHPLLCFWGTLPQLHSSDWRQPQCPTLLLAG